VVDGVEGNREIKETKGMILFVILLQVINKMQSETADFAAPLKCRQVANSTK